MNYGLWVIMMHNCWFINCYKCTTLMKDADKEEGCACVGQRVYGKSLYCLFNFAVN